MFNTTFSARHFTATDSLRNYAQEKLEKLGKLHEGILDVQVIFEHVRMTNRNTAEIRLRIPQQTLTAKATADKHTLAFDDCLESMKNQLLKTKAKAQDKRRVNPDTLVPVSVDEDHHLEEDE